MGFAWELLVVGADAALVLFLYKMYRSDSKAADAVKAAPKYEVGMKLQTALEEAESHHLPYACVRGIVKASGETIPSQYEANKEGVIQRLTHVEHKSKRVQGFWSDAKRIIQDTVNSVAFQLVSHDDDVHVNVSEALSANLLQDSLRETHDSFEPTKASFFEAGMDRIFGDVSKGFQKTEHMLTIGTPLLGIGRLTLSENRIVLKPPDSHPYILTTMSRSEVVKDLMSQARVYRFLTWIFGVAGAALLAYWFYKRFRAWRERLVSNQLYREIERDRLRARESRADRSLADEQTCVICLTNPREVVVLECGHICMCGDCAQRLQEPRTCPVCRAGITRLVSTYLP